MTKYKPLHLRNSAPVEIDNIKRNDVYIILDNIMDTFNVGTIFRLSDALAAKKIYLCGITQAPPNIKVKKASINTWQWVPWEYKKETIEAIEDLRQNVPGIKIIAIEQAEGSIPYGQADYNFPVALVVGHETSGVSQAVLDLCDQIVELPMYGVNVSLNVIVALSIVAYKSLEKNNL